MFFFNTSEVDYFVMIDKPHGACHLRKNLLFLLRNILIDNDDYYKSLLNFILRIIEERSCLYFKKKKIPHATFYLFSKTVPMRKLIYKLYIGSYNNKFHAYVHMRCQTVLKLSKNVNIIKILYALRKKTRGYRYMVLSHNRLKMLAFFHFFFFFTIFFLTFYTRMGMCSGRNYICHSGIK